ncbi:MAG TPA: YihY/virulence factor BrkB family protein [Solirubrobacteraceae bacterium]|nr:YihY/virulence factor BrkB family protein [Solirubrobacteraceae bacterium]
MTTARAVPVTRDEELEGDEAFETLRATGRARLAVDALTRFRAADGFSHSRALAFQIALTLVPALIALIGLAETLQQETVRRAVQATIEALAPGAAGDLLTQALRQGSSAAREETGEVALTGGLIAAAFAGTTAMAQIERGANRLYGTERDRPFLRKYLTALLLACTAGAAGLLAVVVLVGGRAIRHAVGPSEGLDLALAIARWPIGIALVVAAAALLFEHAPRRRQPEASWLAFGAAVSAVLWLAFMGVLALYMDAASGFGETYGPLAGTIGLLLWSFFVALALFIGLAFAAQLEAVRAGVPDPRLERDENV